MDNQNKTQLTEDSIFVGIAFEISPEGAIASNLIVNNADIHFMWLATKMLEHYSDMVAQDRWMQAKLEERQAAMKQQQQDAQVAQMMARLKVDREN